MNVLPCSSIVTHFSRRFKGTLRNCLSENHFQVISIEKWLIWYVLHCVFSGVPWTEEEHKLFLLGIQKVGKGDWRGISRNFVKTRTPTQVASHAQKYFLRRSNLHRRRRRSSLFDITTETVRKIVFFYTKHNFFCLSVFELILLLVLEIL